MGLAIFALGRQWLSINDVSCYHHCNNYTSCVEIQCQLTIIKSVQHLLRWEIPHIYSMWWFCLCCRPTSGITQWETTGLIFYLPHSVVFGTLGSFVSGSYKQDYYRCNLRSYLRKSQAMAMPPTQELTQVREYWKEWQWHYNSSSLCFG